MSYNNEKQGYQIYNDRYSSPTRTAAPQSQELEQLAKQQKAMEIAMLKKLHNNTKLVGLLMYKNEVKGIRFYDGTNKKFIDIAPWQLHYFQMSKMKVMAVREIELLRAEAGESDTLLVEFLTRDEVAGIYRANRMVTNETAQALSGIFEEMSDEEYRAIVNELASRAM